MVHIQCKTTSPWVLLFVCNHLNVHKRCANQSKKRLTMGQHHLQLSKSDGDDKQIWEPSKFILQFNLVCHSQPLVFTSSYLQNDKWHLQNQTMYRCMPNRVYLGLKISYLKMLKSGLIPIFHEPKIRLYYGQLPLLTIIPVRSQ